MTTIVIHSRPLEMIFPKCSLRIGQASMTPFFPNNIRFNATFYKYVVVTLHLF